MNYDNAMSVLYGLPWFCQTEVTLQALEPLAKGCHVAHPFPRQDAIERSCHQPVR